MSLFLAVIAVLLVSGTACLITEKMPRLSMRIGVSGAVMACAVGFVSALLALIKGADLSLRLSWHIPYGSFFVQVDALSAFFIIPVTLLSAMAAIYGSSYLTFYYGKKSIGSSWFFYNLLVASMIMVIISRNAVLFLIAWEIMAISSFFLVTFEHEKENVRKAGWLYLIAANIGTAFLLGFFIILGRSSGSLDFDKFAAGGISSVSGASILFMLAVIGFGTKAGFVPFHIWLPEAHPAAPSHVSAVMSGVMIKIGIYGLVRAVTFLGHPQVWWAWVLISIGLVSGIMGVLFAMAQHDIKRLLAYHSVENIGIIMLGLGLGLLGICLNMPVLTVLGFAGGLLHVLNHALFKGLLFLGAGAVVRSALTHEIDHLGGLLKRMPWTGAAFLVGAIAISGLPPLNGFVSEFMIYLGAFYGVLSALFSSIPCLVIIGGLAVIGSMAAACFTKAFGIIFLGEPRTDCARRAAEVDFGMRFPMIALAACCIMIGMTAPFIIKIIGPVLAAITGLHMDVLYENIGKANIPLMFISTISLLFFLIVIIVALLRKQILKHREIGRSVTWDCGYAEPSSRMQYTASSFVQPVTESFGIILKAHTHSYLPKGIFPDKSYFKTHTPDVFGEVFYRPAFSVVKKVLAKFRFFQHGRLHIYIMYIFITLLILLIWKLG